MCEYHLPVCDMLLLRHTTTETDLKNIILRENTKNYTGWLHWEEVLEEARLVYGGKKIQTVGKALIFAQLRPGGPSA